MAILRILSEKSVYFKSFYWLTLTSVFHEYLRSIGFAQMIFQNAENYFLQKSKNEK